MITQKKLIIFLSGHGSKHDKRSVGVSMSQICSDTEYIDLDNIIANCNNSEIKSFATTERRVPTALLEDPIREVIIASSAKIIVLSSIRNVEDARFFASLKPFFAKMVSVFLVTTNTSQEKSTQEISYQEVADGVKYLKERGNVLTYEISSGNMVFDIVKKLNDTTLEESFLLG